MTTNKLVFCLTCCFVLVIAESDAPAETTNIENRVTIVTGEQAPALQKYAAMEMAEQFRRLFEREVVVSADLPVQGTIVLIGSPDTNQAIADLPDFKWPTVSDQGLVIRSCQVGGRSGLVVGGGSPVATMWAAYELGHQFGIRYLLREDIYPDVQPLKVAGFDLVQEPVLRERTWRTVNDFAIGPEAWSVADHRSLLSQLAKMKFNRVMLSVYPWQPFVDYEYRGVKKQTAMLWYGEKYVIDPDSPGRAAFGGQKEFENPDFVGVEGYQALTAAGTRHLRGIIAASHNLGMQVGISISPLEFPREFAKALPGLIPARGLKNLTVAPGQNLKPDDADLLELTKVKIRAYLSTYPALDEIYLTLPEFPEWEQHAELAWSQFGKLTGEPDQFSKLVQKARDRGLVASGDRGERSVKGNIATLRFLSELLSDSELLQTAEAGRIDVTITSIDPALYSVLDKMLPAGAATLNFIDYTARRVAGHDELLKQFPAGKIDARLILTLADDNVGILSQSATRNVSHLVDRMADLSWAGFCTRYWLLAELDPTVFYLSRASWNRGLTARQAHDDLFTTITGKQSVSDRLWLGFGHIEAATDLTDKHDLGFAFPVPGMMMKHYRSEPVPQWWEAQMEQYNLAMIELYRSRDAADPRAQPFLFYYAKRSEYVLDYLNCVRSLRQSAIAQEEGDTDKAIEELEVAVESIYNAIDTVGDVVQGQSDRGLLAVLIAYAYRPVLAEYERLLEEVEE